MQLRIKKSLLFFGISMVVFFVILMGLLFFQGQNRTPPSSGGLTPIPVTISPTTVQGTVQVISTEPTQNALVPIKTNALQFVFSSSVEDKATRVTLYEFSTNVQVGVDTRTINDTIMVTILRPLAPDTRYKATVRVVDRVPYSYDLNFRTEKGEPIDTYPIGIPEKVADETRKERPDLYVANQLPYMGTDFSVDYTITSAGTLQFTASSASLEQKALQSAVKTWLLSLGLTESQISSLSIQYSQ